MRILHVSEPTSGGVLTGLRHLTDQQVRSGHEVHLMAPTSCLRLPGVIHHDWSLVRHRPQGYPRAAIELRRLVRTTEPDVVHLHSFFAGLCGRVLGGVPARPRVPIVYQPHAWSTHRFNRVALVRSVELVERAGARRTDMLLGICQDELVRGAAFGVERPGRVVGIAVDLGQVGAITDLSERRLRREAMGLGEDRLLLVLGRLAHQKGQDLLVRAWEQHHLPGTRLALVGPGDSSFLAALAPTQWRRTVHAYGPADDVREWLQAADVLLLPSRYESVGYAVAEAMAAGLPVVATAVDGVREAVAGGPLPAAGAVVGVGDMAGLLAEAGARLTDDDRWTRESRAARQRAELMFEAQSLAARVEAGYRGAKQMISE